VKVREDGTYLAELKPPRKSDGPPVTVRVIEYTVHTAVEDGGGEESSEVFCLVTSLLGTEQYPRPLRRELRSDMSDRYDVCGFRSAAAFRHDFEVAVAGEVFTCRLTHKRSLTYWPRWPR
jgi:hypothetical protein